MKDILPVYNVLLTYLRGIESRGTGQMAHLEIKILTKHGFLLKNTRTTHPPEHSAEFIIFIHFHLALMSKVQVFKRFLRINPPIF